MLLQYNTKKEVCFNKVVLKMDTLKERSPVPIATPAALTTTFNFIIIVIINIVNSGAKCTSRSRNSSTTVIIMSKVLGGPSSLCL